MPRGELSAVFGHGLEIERLIENRWPARAEKTREPEVVCVTKLRWDDRRQWFAHDLLPRPSEHGCETVVDFSDNAALVGDDSGKLGLASDLCDCRHALPPSLVRPLLAPELARAPSGQRRLFNDPSAGGGSRTHSDGCPSRGPGAGRLTRCAALLRSCRRSQPPQPG